MTDDRFAVIGYDENGHPKVRYCLDPREVTIIRDPERGDEVIGYVWEPVGPVPSPIRTDPPRLTDDEFEDLKQRWIAAQQQRPTWRYPSGRFLRITEHPHRCDQPPTVDFKKAAEGESWPTMTSLAPGTVWQCDDCGRVWVVEPCGEWRPERFWERWRRQREAQ